MPETREVPPRRRVPGLSARSAMPPVWCSSSASSGRSCAATCSGPTASASRRSPSTRSSSTMFFVLAVTGFATEMVPHRTRRPAGVREVVVHRLPLVGAGELGIESTLDTWHQVLWFVHIAAFLVFLLVLPITMLRHMFTSPLNMYLRDRDRPKGAMQRDAEPHGDRARDVRSRDHRGLHLEAAARHRRLHDVRTLHRRCAPPMRRASRSIPARSC